LQDILNHGDRTMLPYISIRGAVKALGPKTIKSDTGHIGVVQMISVNEHSMRRYGNGFWGGSVREIGTSLNDVPFGLRSQSHTSAMIVEIVDPLQATQENLLSTVSTKFTPASAGLASTLMGYFMGNTSTGVETTEKLLTLDTNVTAIGQLSVTSGKFRLSTPMDKKDFPYIISTYPLEHIIERMITRRRGVRVVAYIFYTITAVFAARKVFKFWKAFERKQMRRRILRERAERRTRDNNSNNAISSVDLHLCIVCLTNPREVILIPCGHVAVCLDCLERMDGACPICRAGYTSTHAAYVS